MEIEEVKKEVARIVRKELEGTTTKAFFFGSRISGTATERSDLDVGLEEMEMGSGALSSSPTPVSSAILRSIRSQCEALPTLFSIDIVDFSLLSDEFKQVAKTHTEEIA